MDWKILVALVSVVAAAGCTGSPGDTPVGETGDFTLLVSDQPSAIADFQSLNVTFSEARLFRANASDGDHAEVELASPIVDLTKVTGKKAKEILQKELEAGEYTKIELHVSEVEGISEGQEVDVVVPSEKLMITKNFRVAPNEVTEFVFDIKVVRRGDQSYNLLPVISESGVVGREVEVERQGSQEIPDLNDTGQEGLPDSASSPSGQGN